MIHPYRSVVPKVHPSIWVADSAHLIGDVNVVRIGRGTNIQVNRLGTPTDYLAAVRKG